MKSKPMATGAELQTLVAAAISGKVEVENLDINSPQADKAILEVLRNFGAKLTLQTAL